MEHVNAAIIYYSSTGTVHALARAATEGAEKAGARVRLRKIAELAPPEAISANPAWAQHLQDTADVAEASLDDLAWADAVLFGTPTRFGAQPASSGPSSTPPAAFGERASSPTRCTQPSPPAAPPTADRSPPPGAGEYVLPLGRRHRAPGLHRARPVQVRQSLRHLPRGRRWPAQRRGLGSGPLSGPARRRHRGRTQGRPCRLMGRPAPDRHNPPTTAAGLRDRGVTVRRGPQPKPGPGRANFDDLTSRIGSRFARVEPRRLARPARPAACWRLSSTPGTAQRTGCSICCTRRCGTPMVRARRLSHEDHVLRLDH